LRIFGSILLLGGFLLCLTIGWLPIGLFAMGFGLIFLLASEKRNRQDAAGAVRAGITAPFDTKRSGITPAATASIERNENDATTEWRLLVQSDPELAEVEQILLRYGSQYAGQLARAYIVFKRKAFLPTIVDMVIASAQLNSQRAPLLKPSTEYPTTEQRHGEQTVPAPAIASHQMDESNRRTKLSYLPTGSPRSHNSEAEAVGLTTVEALGEDPLRTLFETIERGAKHNRV
jgi:hypothetical protein